MLDDDRLHEAAAFLRREAELRRARAAAGIVDDEPVRHLHGDELRAARAAAVGLDDEPVRYGVDDVIPDLTNDRRRLPVVVPVLRADGEAARQQMPIIRRTKHPFLPIVAPDYSYVMDLTDMQSLLINKFRKKNVDYIADRVSEVYSTRAPSSLNDSYKYILTIIDTTSRKVWMYPLLSKKANVVYAAFQDFLKDIHGKIARLLSDNDTAFSQIRNHNNFFTYCSVTASHNNHKTLGIIDRFTRTFREILYAVFTEDLENPSWYAVYKPIRDTYNDTKHGRLFLRGRDGNNHKIKFYYTPNQVWYNPRLRSRIRLRRYFDGVKSYGPNTIYRRIRDADRVHIRLGTSGLNKNGNSFFSRQTYPKGIKRGNAWYVNGNWYTYRNLIPENELREDDLVPVRNNSRKVERRKLLTKNLKRHQQKQQQRQQQQAGDSPLLAAAAVPGDDFRLLHVRTRRANELGQLLQDQARMFRDRSNRTDEQRARDREQDARSSVDVGVDAIYDFVGNNNNSTGYNLRSRKRKTNNNTDGTNIGGYNLRKRKRKTNDSTDGTNIGGYNLRKRKGRGNGSGGSLLKRKRKKYSQF